MCTFWTSCSHVCEPNISWKVLKNESCESRKTLEFSLCKSWKVQENSILLSVRTLYLEFDQEFNSDDVVVLFIIISVGWAAGRASGL